MSITMGAGVGRTKVGEMRVGAKEAAAVAAGMLGGFRAVALPIGPPPVLYMGPTTTTLLG